MKISPARRHLWLLILILILCPLPGCVSPATISYFPVQKSAGLVMQALNYGTLVVDGGCLRLEWDDDSYVMIWPFGYSYRVSGAKLEVFNEKGEFACRTGQLLRVSGGETPSIEAITGTSPPSSCPGPYWVVGSEIQGWKNGIAWLWAFNTAASLVVALAVLGIWHIMQQ